LNGYAHPFCFLRGYPPPPILGVSYLDAMI
jgi:hypothetical protein